MDVPSEVLEVLKCGRCEEYLSRAPMYLENNEAAICGRCYTSFKCSATRSKQYEALAKLHNFPCKYWKWNCSEKVPYAGEDEEIEHEKYCEQRQYDCLVLDSDHCDWRGSRDKILQHWKDKHFDRFFENSATLVHDITKASEHNYIISTLGVLFLLHTKVCVTSKKIFHAVRLLGPSAEAVNFSFMLDIQRGVGHQVRKKRQVEPQDCLKIEEATSLIMNINSLLDVLGGFDLTTFTVKVERIVSKKRKTTGKIGKRRESAKTVKQKDPAGTVKRRLRDSTDQQTRGGIL